MRIGALDHLAVELQDQPQHAVRGRMLRAEIQCVAIIFDHRAAAAPPRPVASASSLTTPPPAPRLSRAFSSPGSVVIASHGERKSKLRNSCVSRTGS